MATGWWRICLGALVVAAGASCAEPLRGGRGGDDDCEQDEDCDEGEVCDDGECVEGAGDAGGGGGGGAAAASTAATGGAAPTGTTASAGPAASSSAAGATSSSSGPVGCDTEPTFALCADCFSRQNPAGYEAYVSAFLLACACAAGATCNASCDTGQPAEDPCVSPGVVDIYVGSQACVDCVNGIDAGDACIDDFSTGCLADFDCEAFVTDLQTCPG